MIIYGYDGNQYGVHTRDNLSYLMEDVVLSNSGLRYIGPNKTVRFVVNGRHIDYKLEYGFEWDGASIPKGFRWLIGNPTDKEFILASMFHDLGYSLREKRVYQDVIFYYLLMWSKVPHWKADVMYKAVRAGGHAYYASDSSRAWRLIRRVLL